MTTFDSNDVNKDLLRDEAQQDNYEMNGLKWSSQTEKHHHDLYTPEGPPARVDGSPERLFALETQPSRSSTFERKSMKIVEAEKKTRRQWYPILLLSIALNICLLAGTFYIIYEADYYSESRRGFMWKACLIIFVPLFPIAVLLLWPFSTWWKQRRDGFSEQKASPKWRHIVNIINAVASFVIVLCFLFFSAVPKYNRPVWTTAVDFSGSIPVPAVAMVLFQSNVTTAQGFARFADLSGANLTLAEPAVVVETDETLARRTYSYEDREIYRQHIPTMERYPFDIDAIVTNSTLVTPTVATPLQYSLTGNVFLSYEPVDDPRFIGLRDTPPIMVLAAFDPRLTLEEVMLCSIVQGVSLNSFAFNTMLMSVTTLSDPRRKMVRPPDADPICERAYSLLETANPPIALFDTSLTASQTMNSNFSEECRPGQITDVLACSGGFQLAYGSQFVTTQASVPGKSKQDIWIDCGAIVGAIQFFAWFLLVFFEA